MDLFMRDATSQSPRAQAQAKCRRGTRSDLARILETLPEIQAELREERRLLEILTACQAADSAQHGECGSRH
jgi:hypothetical protein